VAEAIGYGLQSHAYGLGHKKYLILRCIDALIDDGLVGLIFMDGAEVAA